MPKTKAEQILGYNPYVGAWDSSDENPSGMWLVRPTKHQFVALAGLYGPGIWTQDTWMAVHEVTDATRCWMIVDSDERRAGGMCLPDRVEIAPDAVPVRLEDPAAWNLGEHIYRERLWAFQTEFGPYLTEMMYAEQVL